MKKLLVCLLFFMSNLFFTYSQPSIQWQSALGGTGNDYGNSVQQTTDGGYIVAGFSDSNDSNVTGNNGNRDFWIVKLDVAGAVQWQKSFGGSADDVANSIRQTNDGGYVVAGYSESNDSDVTGNHGHRDFWIVKIDSSGSLQLQRSLGGTDFDVANSILQTGDGGYIVAGYSSSNDGDLTWNRGAQDYWIIKLDSAFAISWQLTYGGTFTDEAQSIQQTADGGFIVAGYTYSSNGNISGYHGNQDSWIVKLDSAGIIQWQKSLGGTSGEQSNFILQTADDGFVIAGASKSNDGDVAGNHGGYDYWIIKLDTAGVIEWQKSLGGGNDDFANSIGLTSDGGYIVTGYTASNDSDVSGNNGSNDYWAVKLSGNGGIDWQLCLGGTDLDGAKSIQQTADDGYVVCGSTLSIDGDVTGNHGGSDYWVVKLSSFVAVNEIQKAVSNIQIFPNPVSNSTVISFHYSASENIHIEISDMQGRLIRNLVFDNLVQGTNEINWDATSDSGIEVENGIYFISVVSDNICETKKVEVLKN